MEPTTSAYGMTASLRGACASTQPPRFYERYMECYRENRGVANPIAGLDDVEFDLVKFVRRWGSILGQLGLTNIRLLQNCYLFVQLANSAQGLMGLYDQLPSQLRCSCTRGAKTPYRRGFSAGAR